MTLLLFRISSSVMSGSCAPLCECGVQLFHACGGVQRCNCTMPHVGLSCSRCRIYVQADVLNSVCVFHHPISAAVLTVLPTWSVGGATERL